MSAWRRSFSHVSWFKISQHPEPSISAGSWFEIKNTLVELISLFNRIYLNQRNMSHFFLLPDVHALTPCSDLKWKPCSVCFSGAGNIHEEPTPLLLTSTTTILVLPCLLWIHSGHYRSSTIKNRTTTEHILKIKQKHFNYNWTRKCQGLCFLH